MLEKTNATNKFLDVTEASNYLKVAVATLYSWVSRKEIPFRKHGSKLVFEMGELDLWSKQNHQAQQSVEPSNTDKEETTK